MNRLLILVSFVLASCTNPNMQRQETSLNGTWEFAKTDLSSGLPSSFNAMAPVPGLVDMAVPSTDVAETVYEDAVYWYKKTFRLEHPDKSVALLKINKAKYHTRVYLNGVFVGENTYSFTPSLFDIKPFLRPGSEQNELIIAVGCKNNLPDTVTNGSDFEKTRYIPGIYDDVKIIQTGLLYIANVQIVPDIVHQQVRVVAEIEPSPDPQQIPLFYTIREVSTGRIFTKGKISDGHEAGDLQIADFLIDMKGSNLWSPETPFLYELELATKGDNLRTRFGMRSFAASSDSGVFLLNGKPYYMRGTNVTIFRFFEDPDRGGLPWDNQWATDLHLRFKDMHWNSIRYCIGFPPERWYEIADSLGFLIQDEYPLWTGGKGGFEASLPGVTPQRLAEEYRHWIRERQNHPSVVIWDAQNESVTDVTGKAIQIARKNDLSNRPWDNGWAAPASPYDAIESHPYLFVRYFKNLPAPEGYLKELMALPQTPDNSPNQHSPLPDGRLYPNPIIINEYGWIWLNRDGSTTTLTDFIYERLFPWADTPQKRLEIYAKTLGIKTEYWRAHRKAAAVMHFCGLGYSRSEKPRGQTSDNFIDIQNLVFEPHFYKHVKPSFSPLGIMLDFWDAELSRGQKIQIPAHIFNDTYETISDTLRLDLYMNDGSVSTQTALYHVNENGKTIINLSLSVPNISGRGKIEGTIKHRGETIKSIREFTIQ